MPEDQIHVATWGRDSWPGTRQQPLATLAAAQRTVRSRTASQRHDLVVSLHAGTHVLAEALILDAAAGDSGRHGHRVIYQPHGYGTAQCDEVVVSGGRTITGWRPGPDGSWHAEVGGLQTRQLYVNGRRAPRAALSSGIPGTVTKTGSGYVTNSTIPQTWQDPASIELVFRGVYPWSEARCGIAAISGDRESTTITLVQPGFDRARELYSAQWHGAPSEEATEEATEDRGADGGWDPLAPPSTAENSVSFLTEPGTFALDRTVPGRHVLHYLPLPGEDPARAEIIAPVLETLVVGAGTAQDPLHDVTLRGLTFAHTGWTAPSGPAGFLHYHGNTYHDGGPVQRVEVAEGLAQITIPTSPAMIPAGVQFTFADRITVQDNRFTRFGAGAVGLRRAGGGTAILDNVLDDVSGGGVAVDSGTGVRVEGNLIHGIGCEYHGSPAVWVADSRDVSVARNEIHDVPYSGVIVMGGDHAGRVEVAENLIHHTMTVLADGGGIYLAGRQGASYASGTVVRGNVIRDTITPYNFGLYTDYGAAWVTVLGNIVYRGDTPVVLRVTPPLENVAFLGNFWDDHPAGNDAPPPGVTLAGNTVLPRDGFEQALAADPAGVDILTAAGRITRVRN